MNKGDALKIIEEWRTGCGRSQFYGCDGCRDEENCATAEQLIKETLLNVKKS